MSLPGLMQPYVVGSLTTPIGRVPEVGTELHWEDHLGTSKARWGIGRMHYTVQPGLYAVGRPDSHAPVLVTANYKMSFDKLRTTLSGKSLWILVLDTRGINVWCAAGKGTFGTEELVSRIRSCKLDLLVTHRRLIVPQLGAPGISAHQVKKQSGFKVVYGPIRASDLAAFLDDGMKASLDMRRQTFTTIERAVLVPMELVAALKSTLFLAPILFILGGLTGPGRFLPDGLTYGGAAFLAVLSGIAAGAMLTPLLLPWLPGRAFSIKGLSVGVATAFLFAALRGPDMINWPGYLEWLAWLLLIPAISGYLALNFTGCSTYTSLSGVKKETRLALPLEAGAGVIGLGVWFLSRLAL